MVSKCGKNQRGQRALDVLVIDILAYFDALLTDLNSKVEPLVP